MPTRSWTNKLATVRTAQLKATGQTGLGWHKHAAVANTCVLAESLFHACLWRQT